MALDMYLEENQEPESQLAETGAAEQALQAPPVIKAIAKYLPAAALFPLRGISRDWGGSCTPEIKKIHKPIEIHQYNAEQLGQVLASSTNNPFVSFRITDGFALNFNPLQGFFSRFGNTVQRLAVNAMLCQYNETERAMYTSLPSIREIVFNLTPELEELKVDLHMDYDRTQRTDWHHMKYRELMRLVWEGLLPVQGNAPDPAPKLLSKLKKLIFKSGQLVHQELLEAIPGLRVGDFLIELFMAAGALEELKLSVGLYNHKVLTCLRDMPPPHIGRLRGLSMDHVRAEELRILAELGRRHQDQHNAIQLQKLKLHNLSRARRGQPDASMAALATSFLETQAHHLLKFKFELCFEDLINRVSRQVAPIPVLQNVNIPQMDRLQTLGISGTGFEFGYEAGTFSSNFPALKKLLLDVGWAANVEYPEYQNFWESIQHPGLNHLISRKNLPPEALTRLASTLPSLTRLEFKVTEVTPNTFPVIWKSWPALQTLHIHYEDRESRNVDELLSGIPSWTFPKLKKELAASAPFNLDVIHWLLFPYKTKPGISDLRQLQKFVLDFRSNSYELTDIGGLFGLAMVGAGRVLTHLEINDTSRAGAERAPQMMSPQCHALIREALGPFAYIKL